MNSAAIIIGRVISWSWKIIIFLIAFAIVLFISLQLRLWSGDFTLYFLRTGDWGMLLFMLLVTTAISMVLIKLLQWQFHIETMPLQKWRRRFK
ncbi:MAG: hypothetical protein PHD95_04850 [Candidatus ainarchaeum sp.]|nr:hypothetical protein [Candidatus ainarchaeum sp.]